MDNLGLISFSSQVMLGQSGWVTLIGSVGHVRLVDSVRFGWLGWSGWVGLDRLVMSGWLDMVVLRSLVG